MFRRGLVTLHIWEVKASWEHTELTGSVIAVIFFKTDLSMGHFTVLFHMGFSSCSFYLLPCLCLVDIIFTYFISIIGFLLILLTWSCCSTCFL